MLAGIKPETHSPGMFSWFPILFPLKVSSVLFLYTTFSIKHILLDCPAFNANIQAHLRIGLIRLFNKKMFIICTF